VSHAGTASANRANQLRRVFRGGYDPAEDLRQLVPTLTTPERAAVQKGVKAAQYELRNGVIDNVFGWKRDAKGVVYVWDSHDEGLATWGKHTTAAADLLGSNVSPYANSSYDPREAIPAMLFRLGFLATVQGIFEKEKARYIPIALARRKRGAPDTWDNDGEHGPLIHDEDMLDAQGVYRNNGRGRSARRR
jgi:hypothetical protein